MFEPPLAIILLDCTAVVDEFRFQLILARGVNWGERRSGWCFHRRNAVPAVLREESGKPSGSTGMLFLCDPPNLTMEHSLY